MELYEKTKLNAKATVKTPFPEEPNLGLIKFRPEQFVFWLKRLRGRVAQLSTDVEDYSKKQSEDLSNVQDNVADTINNLYEKITLGQFYVGIVLGSADNPANHFPSEWNWQWERISGQYVRADKDLGVTGGSNQHTLTVAQMPRHTHKWVNGLNTNSVNDWDNMAVGGTPGGITPDGAANGIADAGGNQPFTIEPSYVGIPMWRRVS